MTASKLNTSGLNVPNAQHANSANTAGSATTANVARGLTTLPSGATESGNFTAAGGSPHLFLGAGVSFAQPLPAPVSNVQATTTTTANCPGVGQAAPGYLCLYVGNSNNVSSVQPSFAYTDLPTGGGRYGVALYWDTSATTSYINGTWSATAS